MKAQCSYNHIGEPTVRDKEKGVRQEGLPVGLIMGGTMQYGSCDTIDYDLKAAKEKRADKLQAIQQECYSEAKARGVSLREAYLQ